MILVQLGAAYFSETKILTKIPPFTRRPDFVGERQLCFQFPAVTKFKLRLLIVNFPALSHLCLSYLSTEETFHFCVSKASYQVQQYFFLKRFMYINFLFLPPSLPSLSLSPSPPPPPPPLCIPAFLLSPSLLLSAYGAKCFPLWSPSLLP